MVHNAAKVCIFDINPQRKVMGIANKRALVWLFDSHAQSNRKQSNGLNATYNEVQDSIRAAAAGANEPQGGVLACNIAKRFGVRRPAPLRPHQLLRSRFHVQKRRGALHLTRICGGVCKIKLR